MNRALGFATAALEKLLDRKVSEGWLPRSHISGLTLSNNVDDATNDINIAPGVCRSTVNRAHTYAQAPSRLCRHQRDLEFPDITIKRLDVLWAPGNGGGRSASSLADGTWPVFAIGGKGLKDRIFLHDSATESSVLAAMPGGYTAYRRIGAIVRSTSIVPFIQRGNHFRLVTRGLVSDTAKTTRTSVVLQNLPTGIIVDAQVGFALLPSGANDLYVLVTSLNETDSTPSTTIHTMGGVASSRGAAELVIASNTSGEIGHRANTADGNATLRFFTLGWYDSFE